MNDIRSDLRNRINHWHSYSEQGIEGYAPDSSGIYFIVRIKYKTNDKFECVYIGEATDIKERLLQHCKGTSEESTCINSKNPIGFGFISPVPEKKTKAHYRETIY